MGAGHCIDLTVSILYSSTGLVGIITVSRGQLITWIQAVGSAKVKALVCIFHFTRALVVGFRGRVLLCFFSLYRFPLAALTITRLEIWVRCKVNVLVTALLGQYD